MKVTREQALAKAKICYYMYKSYEDGIFSFAKYNFQYLLGFTVGIYRSIFELEIGDNKVFTVLFKSLLSICTTTILIPLLLLGEIQLYNDYKNPENKELAELYKGILEKATEAKEVLDRINARMPLIREIDNFAKSLQESRDKQEAEERETSDRNV